MGNKRFIGIIELKRNKTALVDKPEEIIKMRNQFIEDNIELAKKYARGLLTNIETDDIDQIASLALVKTVDKIIYSEPKMQFIQIFYRILEQEYLKVVPKDNNVINKIQQIADEESLKFLMENEKEPSRKEVVKKVAVIMNESERVITEYFNIIDAKKQSESYESLEGSELIEQNNFVNIFENEDLVNSLFEKADLTEQELNVLRKYCGFDGEILTYEKIGKLYGLTSERIRQIFNKAIKKLRIATKKNKTVKYEYDKEGYDKEGYNRKGYNREGYDREGYNKRGFNAKGINKETKRKYNLAGFDVNGIHQETRTKYNKKGYDQDGYDSKGYNIRGYDRKGFNRRGFNEDGIHKDTGTEYDKKGFDLRGIHKKTNTRYDEKGYDRNGYNKLGYNQKGYDRDGYNKSGYNIDGYNREGYNKAGYNKEGFNKLGYDRDGYNMNGFNKDGINKKTGTSYDETGYDVLGFNEKGFDQDGFDVAGFNQEGFNRAGEHREKVRNQSILKRLKEEREILENDLNQINKRIGYVEEMLAVYSSLKPKNVNKSEETEGPSFD